MNAAPPDPTAAHHPAAPLSAAPLPAASLSAAPHPGRGDRILSLEELVNCETRMHEQKIEMLLMVRAGVKIHDWQAKAVLFDAELARLDNEIQAKRELQARLVEDARVQKRAAEMARVAQEQAQERQMRQWGTRRWGLHQSF
jgi:hypothetical protein